MTKLSALIAFAVVLWLTGCGPKDEELIPTGTTGAPVNVNNPSQTFDPAGQTLLLQGTFTGSGSYRVSGMAKVYEKAGKRTLVFENFSSSAGPDLRIYMAETTNATNFVEVSRLSNTGNFFIEIPAAFDPAKQRVALIWCKQFNVAFGSAQIR